MDPTDFLVRTAERLLQEPLSVEIAKRVVMLTAIMSGDTQVMEVSFPGEPGKFGTPTQRLAAIDRLKEKGILDRWIWFTRRSFVALEGLNPKEPPHGVN